MVHRDWTDRLLDTMISSDRTAAAEIISQALASGIAPMLVITDILDPALVRLGRRWEQETLSLAQGFVAAKIAEDAMLRCIPERTDQYPTKGVAVIGNIEDDFHSLGRRTVALFLAAAGWEVHDLGNDVPAEQFIDTALAVNASVIGASAMMQTTALNIRRLRELIDSRGLQQRLKLAVGGAVFNWRPDLVAEVGGDGTARNAVNADELFMRLQSAARAGGRP